MRDNSKKLREAFELRYCDNDAQKWLILDQLLDERQKPNQAVQGYIDSVKKMGQDLGKPDGMIMELIIRGLQPDIRAYVLQKEPKTIDDLTKHAKFAQCLHKDTQQRSNTHSVVVALAQQVEQMQQMLMQVNQASSQQQSNDHQQPRKQWQQQRPQASAEYGKAGQQSRKTNNQHTGGRQESGDSCSRCGKHGHSYDKCKSIGQTCYKCGRQDHYARACRTALKNYVKE